MLNLKVLLTTLLLLPFIAFAQITDITKISDWDQLDRYLRSQEPAETVRVFKEVSARLPKPTWEDYGYESAILLTAKAHQRLGQESERKKLFQGAVSNMEDILKQVEQEGDLDDYKEYCWSIGNMCQAAGSAFKEKQDYYYDQRENAQPKTNNHSWDAVSEKLLTLYSSGDHAGAVALYENALADIGKPEGVSDGYSTASTYMAAIYSALGNEDKAAEMSAIYMQTLISDMDDDERALYGKSMALTQDMAAEAKIKEGDREARESADVIGNRLGAEQKIFEGFGSSDVMPAQSKEMWKQMLYMDEEYQNAHENQKEQVLNRLAREQLGPAIKEINPTATIPANATFDQVFDMLNEGYTGAFQSYQDAFESSGFEDAIKGMQNDVEESVTGIIEFYTELIEANEKIMLFSKADYEATKELGDQYSAQKTDEAAATEIIVSTLMAARADLGGPMSQPETAYLQSVIQNQFANQWTLFGYEVDKSIMAMGEEEEEDYFEVFSDWISDSEEDYIKNETLYYKILKDELLRANASGELLAINDIQGLSLGSKKLDNWAKYQEIFDRAAFRIMENELFNVFEEYAPLDYNQMLASRSLDYKTQKFLMEGVQASGDEDLKARYETLRQNKESIGRINMLPDTVQAALGWNAARKAKVIDEISESERTLYESILKVKDFGAFARSYFITWQDIQKSLKPNEAFVDVRRIQELKNGDSRAEVSYLYVVINPTGDPKIVVAKNVLIEERMYVKLKSKELSNTDRDGRKPDDLYTDMEVYQNFWQPLASQIDGGSSTVYLLPDGLYHNLSFDCMITPSGKYLFEKTRVVRLTEIADVRDHSARTNAPASLDRNLYFFGFPAYGELPPGAEKVDDSFSKNLSKIYKKMFNRIGRIGDLPGSLVEVKTIDNVAQTNGYKSILLTGIEANESRLKSLSEPDIIHLATHGKFIEEQDKSSRKLSYREQKLTENPMLRSHIYLAGAEKARKGKIVNADNGIVTAEEVSHLDLAGVKLVVLSACQTALGKTYSGEGIYGLQRAFLQAGAETVVISLWEVSDEATKLLMTEFYTNLLIKKKPKYEALKLAQLTVKEKYPHPHYWAPFIMVGK